MIGRRIPPFLLACTFSAYSVLLLIFVSGVDVFAGEPVDYLRDVKPILAKSCYACHGSIRQKGGLRLDTAEFALRGGDSGAAIELNDGAASLLVQAVTGEAGFRMPPDGEGEPLAPAEIETIKAWIDAGAPLPADEASQPDPQDHWAFSPPQWVAPPAVTNAGWAENEIDLFLAAAHERHGLRPSASAEPATLLRRVYLDLIGVPPTRDELHDFLTDESPGAFEAVVDRLLASPQYGERWGRHWMDVWRYSDSFSSDANGVHESQPHVWRWRSWIVESLNADKPYDRMIVEMLAGDELAPQDADTLRATGFLVRNFDAFNRNGWLQKTVDHTAMGFLGLTLKCARCHDHKYDPISQAEYFQFRAIFEPHQVRTDRVPGEPDTAKSGLVRAYDADVEAATYLLIQGDERRVDKDKKFAPATPAFLRVDYPEPSSIDLPPAARYPALREFVQEEEIARVQRRLAQAQTEAAEATKTDDDGRRRIADKALAAARAEMVSVVATIAADEVKLATPPAVHAESLAVAAAQAQLQFDAARLEVKLVEAEANLEQAKAALTDDEKSKEAVAKAEKAVGEARQAIETQRQSALKEASPDYTSFSKLYAASSSGRRLALARWITDPRHPLASRVAVNHIWMRHFGKPLVSTVFDFGLNGTRPTHPELLDWLALRFIDDGWSMKRLHRLIVTSAAYRMSSDHQSLHPNAAIDPDNTQLWRMELKRMEAEIVRDSLLAAAGELDFTQGGPELDEAGGLTSRRKSLYFRQSRENQMEFLALFDAPPVDECYRRDESIIPQQALALSNSALSVELSRRLAKTLNDAVAGDDAAAFVRAAFEQVLNRGPTSKEQTACEQFLAEQSILLSATDELSPVTSAVETAIPPSVDPHIRARENLVHVLFNHNDFVSIR